MNVFGNMISASRGLRTLGNGNMADLRRMEGCVEIPQDTAQFPNILAKGIPNILAKGTGSCRCRFEL
jgi:hypothetical protein